MIDFDSILSEVVGSVVKNKIETTFGVDGADLSAEQIFSIIDKAKNLAQNGAVTLRGVRVGGDILAKLGGAHEYINAQLHKEIPIVAVSEFGKVELVFRS
jgi:hypothetical protein